MSVSAYRFCFCTRIEHLLPTTKRQYRTLAMTIPLPDITAYQQPTSYFHGSQQSNSQNDARGPLKAAASQQPLQQNAHAYSQAFVPPSQPVTDGKQLPTSMPLPVLPAVEAAKRLAAFAAVDRHIGLEHHVRLCRDLDDARWVKRIEKKSTIADMYRSLVLGQDRPCRMSWIGSWRRARRRI